MADDPKICIKVPVVVGQNSVECMIVTRIPLKPPLFAIKDITKHVTVDNCLVQDGLVIIDGTLHKNINYKTLKSFSDFPDGGAGAMIADGDVRHTHVWLPFHCFVNIPGAQVGDDCQIESATVIGEKDEPLDPLKHPEEPMDADDCPLVYRTLLEKAVIQLVVKVTRTEQVTVHASTPGVCPT